MGLSRDPGSSSPVASPKLDLTSYSMESKMACYQVHAPGGSLGEVREREQAPEFTHHFPSNPIGQN